MGLTDIEQAILNLEQRWFKYAGAKETESYERLGMSATRYYQVLNASLDRPEALAHDPLTAKRLRRLRDLRRTRRAQGSLAVQGTAGVGRI